MYLPVMSAGEKDAAAAALAHHRDALPVRTHQTRLRTELVLCALVDLGQGAVQCLQS